MAGVTGVADVPAPFQAYQSEVDDAWLDYNGHMNDASYAVVLSQATELLLEWLDLSAGYRGSTGAGLYTAESHIRFLAECSRGQMLSAASFVIAVAPKRVRIYTELYVDGETLAASGDSIYIHVDGASGRSAPIPEDRYLRLEQLAAAHATLARPEQLGEGVGARWR
jgi:acyl-CoA thioester hydrolase